MSSFFYHTRTCPCTCMWQLKSNVYADERIRRQEKHGYSLDQSIVVKLPKSEMLLHSYLCLMDYY